MTAKEWLGVMQQAEDYNPALTKLIEKYGEMCATEALAYKGEDEGFLNFIVTTKNKFVKKVNEQEWNTELRTEAENIIIAYDQMMNKLFDCNWVIPSYKDGEDLEQEIERLKKLIKEGFVLVNKQWHKSPEKIEADWKTFQKQNNL